MGISEQEVKAKPGDKGESEESAVRKLMKENAEALDKRVITSTDSDRETLTSEGSDPDNSRKFTTQEFTDLITYADLLYQADNRSQEGEKVKSILESLSLDDKNIPSQALYKAAKELGIPREYVTRTLDIHSPSIKCQLEDLKNCSSIPVIETLRETYRRKLERVLKRSLPFSKVSVKIGECAFHDEIHFYRIREQEYEKKFLFWKWKKKKKKKEPLANLEFRTCWAGGRITRQTLDIYLMDPIFLRICGETLEQLKEQFKDAVSSAFTHGYIIE